MAEEKSKLTNIIGDRSMGIANDCYLSAMKELQTYSYDDVESMIRYASDKVETELPIRENRELAILYLLDSMKKGTSKKEEYDKSKITRRLQRLMSYIDKVDFNDIDEAKMDAKHHVTRFVQMVGLLAGVNDAKEIKQIVL